MIRILSIVVLLASCAGKDLPPPATTECIIQPADTGYEGEQLLSCKGMPPVVILNNCTIPAEPWPGNEHGKKGKDK